MMMVVVGVEKVGVKMVRVMMKMWRCGWWRCGLQTTPEYRRMGGERTRRRARLVVEELEGVKVREMEKNVGSESDEEILETKGREKGEQCNDRANLPQEEHLDRTSRRGR